MNTIQDGVTFGAKLTHYNIKGNKGRWSEIARIFETKTKKYPNDVFNVETNDKGGIYFHPQYANMELSRLNSYDKGEISKRTANFLSRYSDETIAKVLANIFMIRKKADAMLADYLNLEKKHGLIDDIYKEYDAILVKFFDRAIKTRKDMAKILLKRDNVLKNLKGIFII